MTAADHRHAWLEWRRGGLGASDVAAVLGISPWASPWSVWAEKVGLVDPSADSDVMEFGRRAEPMISSWFEDRSGLHVVGEQTWLQGPEEWARCTVDGFVIESPEVAVADATGLLEIKTAWKSKAWDEIPAHYQAQAQWQMYVSGLERVWFAVLHGRRLETYELKRDQGDIDFMVERAREFWTEHVVEVIPPATDSHDATLRALAEVYADATPDASVPLDDLVEVIETWKAAKRALGEVKETEKGAAAAIKAALADAEEGTVDGERVVSWRSQTRKSYVVKEATFRVLRPHEPKEQER